MLLETGTFQAITAAADTPAVLYNIYSFIQVLIGFSIIIFVHELGHFLAAKWVGIRVDRFSVGFGPRLLGYRRGEGMTVGRRPEYSASDLRQRGYGETDYCLKLLPVGGYVKMLGEDDFVINEETGEMRLSDDPRAFTSRPVGHRMIVVSAGVLFNLLFAALLLMGVFLVGKNMTVPEVGVLLPDTPAQEAGLMPGDRIQRLNGRRVWSYGDVIVGTALGGDEIRLLVEREENGQTVEKELVAKPESQPGLRMRALQFTPPFTTKLISDWKTVGKRPALKVGDNVTHVDGEPVSSAFDIQRILAAGGGKLHEFTAERPLEEDKGSKTVTAYGRALLALGAAEHRENITGNSLDSMHLLGLRRRRLIEDVSPGLPADKAGFKAGDVISAWGGIPNPIYEEIIESIKNNVGHAVPVVVERGGEPVSLTVTPSRPFKLTGTAKPRIGVVFSNYGETDVPVVAAVAENTPFAELHLPRGSRLLTIDGQPIGDWYDVTRLLMASAGKTVEVTYESGGVKATGNVSIPGSLVNELDLPLGAVVWAVDGERRAKWTNEQGKEREANIANNSLALREALRQKIGQTVSIRYSPSLYSTDTIDKPFVVREDNIDAWQLRVSYTPSGAFAEKTANVSAHGNPFVAMLMGLDYARSQVEQMYILLTQIATRRVGTDAVAGPIGVISMAVQHAKAGVAELLFFLAFLSVNLAVINFLPMPVMDGGLMVFLIIEKIKGSPVSLKVQMISTMVGLAAIVLIGLWVTVQDIGRLFS